MVPLGLFGTLGLPEILLILLIVVVLFGAKRIPELARGLGEGIRGFRTALRGEDKPPTPGTKRKDEPPETRRP